MTDKIMTQEDWNDLSKVQRAYLAEVRSNTASLKGYVASQRAGLKLSKAIKRAIEESDVGRGDLRTYVVAATDDFLKDLEAASREVHDE